uniref:type II toxin-antitoxin system RelE/ParE family toxin n=1 Tax=Candidatus Electrothrix sp. TaxID=2170559 RepID=UPI00405667D4
MSRYQLVISPVAQNDFKNIFQFGLRHWGKNQSISHLNNLKNHLWTLTQHPHIGIERPELQPEIRSIPSTSHVIFYRIQAQTIEIIRILHVRQDPSRLIE